MDQNPSVLGVGALARKAALEKVLELSGPQAHEIWRAMQLIATNGSLNGLPGTVVELARDLNHFLEAWKVVAERALIHERNSSKQKRRAFWV